MQAYWEANPFYKVAYDQLLEGPTNVATAGSVIGNYTGTRDAIRDAENSMFLEGTAPRTALQDAAKNATAAMEDYTSRLGG
jgi:ABC-type glycerol-3-phosphate transport system substrate-binding protein